MTDLDAPTRLLAAATPGPWTADGYDGILEDNAALRNAAPTLLEHERERERLLRIERVAKVLQTAADHELAKQAGKLTDLRAALRGGVE